MVKKAMISAAKEVIAVFDDSKFDHAGVNLFADFSQINTIITTSSEKSKPFLDELRKKGIHIILADEPVAALDPVTAKQVMQDFVRINQEMGISILLNIHHVELALEYADRIIGIRAGKIVYDGPSDKVDQAVLDSIYGEDTGTEASV